MYTVAVTRETKPVTAVAGKTGTSSAAKGKDAASSEKPAESEAAEAHAEAVPATTHRCDGSSARRGSPAQYRTRRKTPPVR
ncbi:hypothetical protein [Hominenteromicrobium sp.]|uniref:hypothetical protein n=1 Tax=Hominenteromicrobium sp. TaxID=3073581 RepID=UPI00399A0D52